MFERLSAKSRPTFLEASFANRVLDMLNGIFRAQVTPAGLGKFSITENNALLDLTALQTTLQKIQSQIDTLNAQVSALQGAQQQSTSSMQLTLCDGSIIEVVIIP